MDGPSHDYESKYHWIEGKMDLSSLLSERGEESNDKEKQVQETSEDIMEDYFDDLINDDDDDYYDDEDDKTSGDQIRNEQTSAEETRDELTNVEPTKTNQSDKEQTIQRGGIENFAKVHSF